MCLKGKYNLDLERGEKYVSCDRQRNHITDLMDMRWIKKIHQMTFSACHGFH